MLAQDILAQVSPPLVRCVLPCMRSDLCCRPRFCPHFLVWVIGWRLVLRLELVFEFVQCDLRWSIAKLRLYVSGVARPSLPQLSG